MTNKNKKIIKKQLGRQQILQKSLRLHGILALFAAVVLLLFLLSGLSHVLMVWTGPQQVKFFPPQTMVKAEALSAIPHILKAHHIEDAHLIKVVPTERGNALQVTTDEMAPRRYFDLKTYKEWPDYDNQQAIWLARYYTGLNDAKVVSSTFQTQFDRQYPWVNRLLPVYRVTFDTPDQRTAFVYTEISVLGSLTNDWKTLLQSFFTNVHTMSWLDGVQQARVVLMVVMLLSVLGMLLAGINMLLLMKKRQIKVTSRRWHRRAALVISLPLFFIVLSGAYHLLYYSETEHTTGLKIADRFHIDENMFANDLTWIKQYDGVMLNHLAIVQGPDQQLYYRVSLAQGKAMQQHAEHDHSSRFDGLPTEQGGQYYPLKTNHLDTLTDAQQAVYLATHHSRFDEAQVTAVTPVAGFSGSYDFRNKRLPVWRVDFSDRQGHSVYVDPATGMTVDHNVAIQRLEGWSFSNLHKWNFLTPYLGQAGRDVLVVLFLLTLVILAGSGVIQHRKKRRKNG